jgi:uncharacterized protein (DUF697 family)
MTDVKENETRRAKRPYITDSEELRIMKADKVVRRYMYWSMGAGLIPVPFLDTGTVSLVQLKMLGALSKFYKVSYSKNLVKSLTASLLSFVSGNSVSRTVIPGMLKILPGGHWLGMASMSVFSGASTYAIGKIFIQHFEAGGTFLNFKPRKVKKHFSQLFQEGKDLAKEMRNKERS